MNLPNRIAVDQRRELLPGKIAALSVEELALLQEDLNGAKPIFKIESSPEEDV